MIGEPAKPPDNEPKPPAFDLAYDAGTEL